jgi:hypothetical protein
MDSRVGIDVVDEINLLLSAENWFPMRSRAVFNLVAVSMGLSRLWIAGQEDKSPLRIVTFFI